MSKTGTIDLTQPFVKSLVAKLDKAEAERDALRAENKLLRQVLYDLYAAMPSGYGEDRALNEALGAAEKALGIEKERTDGN